MAVVDRNGKIAISEYKVKCSGLVDNVALSQVAVKIMTGRTHQIRVHMKSIGHPLLGDEVYGAAKENTSLEKKLKGQAFWPGQILHAKVLGFVHPVTGEYMEFDSELPDYFQTVLDYLR